MDLSESLKQHKEEEKVCIIENNKCLSYKDIYDITKENQKFISFYKKSGKLGQPIVLVDILLGWKLVPLYLACMAERITIIPIDFYNSPNQTQSILRNTSGLLIKTDDVNNEGRLTKIRVHKKITYYKELSNVAYVLYTSGTTRSPKGVMLTYKNIISNSLKIKERLTISQKDRILIIRPLLYASSITGELIAGLLAGASFVFKKHSKSPLHSVKLMNKYNISMISLTPSLMLKILQLKNHYFPESLSKIVLSGERLYVNQFNNFYKSVRKNIQFYNAYGLTEASPRISIEKIDSIFQEASVGYPLSNLKIKITDESGNQVSKGTKGILHVKGSNIMKGYFRKKRLSEQVLDKGWLKTNDIANILGDNLFIYGRADNMFIRNGVNLQLEDIEELLKATPYVVDTFVEKKLKDNGLYELVAHIIPTDSYNPILLNREILEWDKRYWPDKIKIQQEIPNLYTGKLSRSPEKQTKYK